MTVTVGLRFTDGTTTVTLGSSGYILDYQAKNALSEVETIQEKCTVLLTSSLSTVRTTIESLNRLFNQARQWQLDKSGGRVFVERQLDTSESWWRSEIVSAMPLALPKTLDFEIVQGKMQFDLIFTRRNWWEGAEAQIPLTNGNGTNNTSGLTVYNHDDAGTGHDNWVTIAAASVEGDLPGPTRLELTNAHSNGIWRYWIGQSVGDPATFTPILEAESATGGSNVVDSYCSNGNYSGYVLASGAEAEMFSWTISAAQLAAAQGRYYKPLMRIRTTSGDSGMVFGPFIGWLTGVYYRFKIRCDSLVIYTGDWTYDSGELPVLRIPSQLVGQTGLMSINLILCAIQYSGAPVTINVDFVMLLPIDGWRKISFAGSVIAQTYRLMDDGINGIVYGDTGPGSTGKRSPTGTYGQQIWLKPNTLQRLYFLWECGVSSPHVNAMTQTVKLYYRPRRLTLN